MNKKITYLFGAGASYGALPINEEIGNDMIRLPSYLDYTIQGYNVNDHTLPNPYALGTEEHLLFEIMRLGYLANENKSIDIYAQALINNPRNLHKLKMVLSAYFTIISRVKRSELIGISNVPRPISQIDNRIYQLIVKSIDIDNGNKTLVPEMNILTWNYDLQVELAMQKYLNNTGLSGLDLNDLNENHLRYMPDQRPSRIKQQLWHLNGVAGHYRTTDNNKVVNMIDRLQSSPGRALQELKYISDSASKGSISFEDHMCFAWEMNEYISVLKQGLVDATSNTAHLIVVGYSFPDRNLKFDRWIIEEMFKSNKNMEIIIHDKKQDYNYFSKRLNVAPSRITFDSIEEIHPPEYFW